MAKKYLSDRVRRQFEKYIRLQEVCFDSSLVNIIEAQGKCSGDAMKNNNTPAPHNAVFKTFLSHQQTARDFMKLHLPPALFAIYDPSTLRLESGSDARTGNIYAPGGCPPPDAGGFIR